MTPPLAVDIADPDIPTPATAAGWAVLVEEEIRAREAAFRVLPSLLTSQGRQEEATTKDYAGRELLELVQNAADAAAELGGGGRVRIEIDRRGLVVANTGQPFRASGVESLMISNTSDKPDRQVRTIGAKGLGFRALLNWSQEPFIASGALEIAFSRSHAIARARKLGETNAKLAKRTAGLKPAVPILAFPLVGEHASRHDRIEVAELASRARDLRREFDTVVAAAFDDDDAFAEALLQAKEFDPRFLLFVPSIETIELAIDGFDDVVWTRRDHAADRSDLSIVNEHGEREERWIVRRTRGETTDRAGDLHVYEILIAIQPGKYESGYLHSYFPTEIPVPFPALFHATLELDSHRKTLNRSGLNETVLAAMADFYAATVASIAKELGCEPLDLLSRNASFPKSVADFETRVYRAVASRPVVPTLSGRRVPVSQTALPPTGGHEFLPKRLFRDLARCRHEEDRTVLQRLGIGTRDAREVVDTLIEADLTLEERAAAILGIVSKFPRELHDRRLLVDTANKPLKARNTCFPPPAKGRPAVLPSWATAKFLHPKLWADLAGAIEGTVRARFQKLATFGIHDFSAEGVITSLRAQAAMLEQRGRMDPDKLRIEVLAAVFAVFMRDGRKSAYPEGSLHVRCADGQWRDARLVHLSGHYGLNGRIVSALYATRPDLLVGSPAANGLSGDVDDIARFFDWIGVHTWPVEIDAPIPPALRPVLKAALPSQFEVSENGGLDLIDRDRASWDWDLKASHRTLAGLADILKGAPSAAILAWLPRDRRLDPALGQPFRTILRARSGRKVMRAYHGALPDLVRHQIRTTAWLDVGDGRQAAPVDAMIAPGRLAELFAVPTEPATETMQAFGLTRELWVRGLFAAGAAGGLGDLDETRIYGLLGSLKTRGASAALVGRLYTQILELKTFDPDAASGAAKQFFDNGRVQCRRAGAVRWVRPQDALYLDRDTYPAAARDLLLLIELPTRRSAPDVERRFGVESVAKQMPKLTLVERTEDAGAVGATLARQWSAALPYIRALRRASTSDTQSLRLLDRLGVMACTGVTLDIEIRDVHEIGALSAWSYVILDDVLMVVISPSASHEEMVYRSAEALGDGLAERFGLQNGADFAKLLAAPTQGLCEFHLRRMLSHLPVDEIDALLSDIEPARRTCSAAGSTRPFWLGRASRSRPLRYSPNPILRAQTPRPLPPHSRRPLLSDRSSLSPPPTKPWSSPRHPRTARGRTERDRS